MAGHNPRFLDRWRTIISDWRTSGLSVSAFCRSRKLNLSGFHRWRNILADLGRSSTTLTRSQAEQKSSPSFVPVRVVPDTVVELILPSGLQLRVPLSADAQQLARLVLALGVAPC